MSSCTPPRRSEVRPDDRIDHVMTLLPRDPRTAVDARDWLGTFLEGHVAAARAADAALVLSELTSNALRHGLGDVVVRAGLDPDGTIKLAVTDSSDDAPALQPADPSRVGGLGLRIVDQLASAWGVATFPGGKTVWATIPASPP
jgi:anti-sigma regulatory factor (Ser/Thr protein kinase)